VSLLFGCGGASEMELDAQSPKASAAIGEAAPEFAAEPVAGKGPKTPKDAHGKVVIVDFWATYCDPCKTSFPAYQKLVEQFKGDLEVIAVSIDEPDVASKEQIAKFAKDAHVKFTVLWDKAGEIRGKTYDVPKMPTAYIIDKTGVIRHMHAGYENGEAARMAQEVKALLQ
jgi:peroxiredoxin